jgi:hypothetical protein
MDHTPPFKGLPVVLQQRLSDDPANEELTSTLGYDPTTGTLNCELTIGIDDSGDHTEEKAVAREEVEIPTQLPTGPIAMLPVEAEFAFELVDHKALRIDEESSPFGASYLEVACQAKPYIYTVNFGATVQIGARHYSNLLAQFGEVWNRDFAVGDLRPNPVEQRSWELKDVKGPLAVRVGIEHTLEGTSNDYAYTYEFTSRWKLTKITTE